MSYSFPLDITPPTNATDHPVVPVRPAVPIPTPPPLATTGAVEGRPVGKVPPPARRGRWQENIDWHLKHPMEKRFYPRVPHTTPGYLQRRYGVVAVGRNTRNNRVDMYMWFDPERQAALQRPEFRKQPVR